MKASRLYVASRSLLIAICAISTPSVQYSCAQTAPNEILLRNVRILDVVHGRLGPPASVLVRGNRIAAIGHSASAVSVAKNFLMSRAGFSQASVTACTPHNAAGWRGPDGAGPLL